MAVAAGSDGIFRFFKGRKKSLWAWAEGRSKHAGAELMADLTFSAQTRNVGHTCLCSSETHNYVASGNAAGFIQIWKVGNSSPAHYKKSLVGLEGAGGGGGGGGGDEGGGEGVEEGNLGKRNSNILQRSDSQMEAESGCKPVHQQQQQTPIDIQHMWTLVLCFPAHANGAALSSISFVERLSRSCSPCRLLVTTGLEAESGIRLWSTAGECLGLFAPDAPVMVSSLPQVSNRWTVEEVTRASEPHLLLDAAAAFHDILLIEAEEEAAQQARIKREQDLKEAAQVASTKHADKRFRTLGRGISFAFASKGAGDSPLDALSGIPLALHAPLAAGGRQGSEGSGSGSSQGGGGRGGGEGMGVAGGPEKQMKKMIKFAAKATQQPLELDALHSSARPAAAGSEAVPVQGMTQLGPSAGALTGLTYKDLEATLKKSRDAKKGVDSKADRRVACPFKTLKVADMQEDPWLMHKELLRNPAGSAGNVAGNSRSLRGGVDASVELDGSSDDDLFSPANHLRGGLRQLNMQLLSLVGPSGTGGKSKGKTASRVPQASGRQQHLEPRSPGLTKLPYISK